MLTDTRKATLVSIVALDDRDELDLLGLAASLAPRFHTPLATAILESSQERGARARDVDSFTQSTASGVVASIAGHKVVLGNAALFAELGLSITSLGDWPDRLRQRGQQVLFVAVDGCTAGFLGVVDRAE